MRVSPAFYSLLADLTLIGHATLVVFVLGGQIAILIGWARAWVWTRGALFRSVHLACIGSVMLEAWFGVTCPLTDLENNFRRLAGEAGYPATFIGSWLDRLLFYSAPEWVFIAAYTLFALVVLLTYLLYPPRFRHE